MARTTTETEAETEAIAPVSVAVAVAVATKLTKFLHPLAHVVGGWFGGCSFRVDRRNH